MSNDPHHWMHFYQLGHATSFPPQLGSATESAVVSTLPQFESASASSSPATHANPRAGGSGGGSASLNPEGGVTKPARRRNRASQRNPATVINTDTTNFHAMVQQFTGAPPSLTFGSGPGPNMLSFGFGQGQGQAPASGLGLGHVQYSHQQQYQHQQYNNLLSLNTNTTTNNNNTSRSNQGGEGDIRLRHFSLEGIGSAPRGSVSMTAVEGGYHQAAQRRSSSLDDNGGNNNNDCIF